MTNFEERVRHHLQDAADQVHPTRDVLAAGEARYHRHRRGRRLTSAAASAVVILVGTAVVATGVREARDIAPAIGRSPGTAPSASATALGVTPSPTATTPGDVEPTTAPASPTEPATPTAASSDSPSSAAAAGDPWRALPEAPLAPRQDHVMVWTGKEAIVWGGTDYERRPEGFADGAAYDPQADSWRPIAHAPAPRPAAEAVWTGEVMVIVGGVTSQGPPGEAPAEGLVYDPDTDVWRETAPAPLTPRREASVTWTGKEIIVWGGVTGTTCGGGGETDSCSYDTVDDGAAYNPETDTWRLLSPSPLRDRGAHGAIWDGRRLVVFGGGVTDEPFGPEGSWTAGLHDAAVYDPAADRWSMIMAPPSIGPLLAVAWTGSEIVYWNGRIEPWETYGDEIGGIWDPTSGAHSPLPAPPFTERRDDAGFLWTGSDVITWGGAIGEGGNHPFGEGARFDPATHRWTRMPPGDGSPLPRTSHATIWTGTEILVWGGFEYDRTADSASGVVDDGAAWTPPD